MTSYRELEPLSISSIALQLLRNTVWQRSDKKSAVSGLWLRSFERTPIFNNCFLNVLPTKGYPYFKYLFKNYVLVTPGEMAMYRQATEEERINYSLSIEEQSKGACKADWGIVKRLEEELKADYKKYFPVTYRGIVNYQYNLMERQRIVGSLNKKFLAGIK